MAESTALEALTAELLGDVGLLHDEVKALKETLPEVVQTLSETLPMATRVAADNLVKATGNIETRLNTILGLVTDQANKVRENSETLVKAAELSVGIKVTAGQKALETKAGELVSEFSHKLATAAAIAVREQVKTPLDNALEKIGNAETTLGIAEGKVEKAANTVSWVWWQRLAGWCGAALLGAALALIGARWLGPEVGGMASSQMTEITKHHRAIYELIEKSCKK